MKRITSIIAALGVLAVFSASPAPAEAGHRYFSSYGNSYGNGYSHSHSHSHVNHTAYQRWLSHHNAHRYPTSHYGYQRSYNNLNHGAYHGGMIHRSSYRPSFGISVGRSGFGLYRSSYGRGGSRGFSFSFGR